MGNPRRRRRAELLESVAVPPVGAVSDRDMECFVGAVSDRDMECFVGAVSDRDSTRPIFAQRMNDLH